MTMLTVFNINDVNGVVIVNCKHISKFALIVDFEKENIWLVHIEKTNTLKTRSGISCIMYYCKCEQNLLTNSNLT